jgi:hypothetical protein
MGKVIRTKVYYCEISNNVGPGDLNSFQGGKKICKRSFMDRVTMCVTSWPEGRKKRKRFEDF